MTLLEKLKPSVSRHNLLLIAGLAWTTAGGILSGRGLAWLLSDGRSPGLRIAVALVCGAVFYLLLFSRISKKHIIRIRGLKIPYPCAFSFFNVRSYILMALMITTGVILRKLDVINKAWLYSFYLTMGVPLLVSAGRFYYFWATKKEIG